MTRRTDLGCCLVFHRAATPAEWPGLPNRPFYLDLAYLERMIAYIRHRGWDIVSLDEALRRLATPGQPRFVNISLDDGYRDTAELVAPLFTRLAAPLTIFVTTGIPDRTLRLRNAGLEAILQRADRVTEAGRTYLLHTPRQRRAAYRAISARWDRIDGDAAYLRFCASCGADPDQLDDAHRITWPMLERLRDTPGIELGAHTISHRRIAALDPADALHELAGSRDRLQDKLGIAIRHFAFPFGQPVDCGPRDADLARRAGFASAATTVKALARPGTDRHALPRHIVNGTHRHLTFAQMHLAGISGVAATVLGRG